jgi:signal transduction histidine kinase
MNKPPLPDTLQLAHSRIAALEARVDELEAFSYSLAHEVRGPVFSIGGFARSIETDEQTVLSSRARAHLRRVIENASLMERLVADLLAFARAQHVGLRKEPCDLGRLTKEVLHDLRFAYPNTRVVVSELPIVQVDVGAARQVLANVIGNAFEYSALAGKPLVQVGLDTEGHVTVSDNGIGFSMDQAESIFEPFERFAPGSSYPGVGVGLAITRRLLRRHGGWIRAQSRPGGPTVFTFSFGS